MSMRCFVLIVAGACSVSSAGAQGLYVPAPYPDDTSPRPTYRQRLDQFPPPGGRFGGGPLEYIATGGRPVPVAPDYAGSVLPNYVHPSYARPGDRRADYGGVAAGPGRNAPIGAEMVASYPVGRHRLPQGGLPPFHDSGALVSAAPPQQPIAVDAFQGLEALPIDFSEPNDFSGLANLFGGGQAYAQPAETIVAPSLQPTAAGAANPIYQRQIVAYEGREAPGTIVIDTPDKFLYLVQRDGRAIRYGIGVGRPGFTWAGMKTVSRKAQWPGWTPPAEMLKRRPDLPRHMAGGEANPLGARALYLGSSMYRIHGTNEPDSIGTNVSSGCIRMMNEDVMDLYERVPVGTRVKVL